ncbi:MAG: DNA polymerase III subunit alpha, partial [Phycisphaerae bacterium]|nr:DNA polymerase III subunit alpha [Phycisphaerae bacterium]
MAGPAEKFVHLHTHSHYSLLDGALRIDDMVAKAKSFGQSAMAITDHGNMFGVIEFYNAALKAGVKPIVGCEFYVAPGDRRDREAKGISDASYHLVLLAMNKTGYQNLLKLASIAYREGFYYRPRIDKQILSEMHEGLICSSACLAGEVPNELLMKNPAAARAAAESYLKIFGPDRYFIEIQDHGLPEQKQTNPELVELAKKLGVGLVASNDAHYLEHGDAHAHDVLCCINTGKLLDDPDRFRFGSDQFYLKSGSQMEDLFADYPEALENTAAIAAKCNLELSFKTRHAPVYKPPAEFKVTPEQYLRQLAAEGLKKRFGKNITDEHRHRIERELSVIEAKGFSSYFLIVWDFCNWAATQGIPAAPRGSGCGTLLGYVLGIGNVNPLQYGLLFERFMDPSRNEMPDIDIDICQIGRAKLIDYVRHKYGHVAQIITFNTLAAKAAIRDVGRVLNVPLPDVDRISKLVPGGPKVTLDSALAGEADFRAAYESDADARRIIDIAKRLEGLARNASVHAAGVVIADRPLENFLPLCGDADEVITQFEGPIVDKVGMLKMDFLGLRTLTVIERARQLVKANHGVDVDPEALTFDDARVFSLFAHGQTDGVFQFESGGMKDLLIKLGPDRLEDLIACNALYRPGPMQMIDDFCARKHKGDWPKVHPDMDAILNETYGIMVYQEQVMQIANRIGGIELSRAYKLIKAISKKQEDIIQAEKENFYKGAQERGIKKQQAEELFALILKFAGYGFNKSHSTRYAIVAYQT